jgi:hypothetical protein
MTEREMRGLGRAAARAAHAQGGDRAVERDSMKWFKAQGKLYPGLRWDPFIDAWWDEAYDLLSYSVDAQGADEVLRDALRRPRR